MFARVSRFSAVRDLDAGLTLIRERVVPLIEKQSGFEGVIVMVDRETDVSFVISFWKSEEDLAASRELGEREVEAAAQTFEVPVETGSCEVVFSTLTFAA